MPSAPLPTQHPQRLVLHNEIHARPPESIAVPEVITHIVMVCNAAQREASRQHLATLLRDHHAGGLDEQATHVRANLGGFRLRWELHTEFVTWTFTAALEPDKPLDTRHPPTAAEEVPQTWFAGLPGQCVYGVHLWLLQPAQCGPAGMRAVVDDMLHADSLAGALVHRGHTQVCTDFAIHADGYSRILVQPGEAVSAPRLGRLVQRLLEIETYRMMALLAMPAARHAVAMLGKAEQELADLAQAIRQADRQSEPVLLDRLTRAYFELVEKRIVDLQEERLSGFLSFAEFMARRLTPARSTCEWAARRQNALSERVSRVSNLLRTRVEIEQQQSNQQLLGSMNERQAMQFKLQSTVEGLSVAAITYYITGLISYLAKGAHSLGWPLSAESTAAMAIPVIAVSVWWSLRRLHHKLFKP